MIVTPLPIGDRNNLYADSRVNSIVAMLLKADRLLYNEIIGLLNITDYSSLIEQLPSVYHLLREDETSLDIFCKNVSHLINIYKDIDDVSHLRGAILEKFVYELLFLKYKNRSMLSLHCYVKIDNWKSTKTVDNFSYSSDDIKGECFECKVKPFGLDPEDINNLNQIYSKSNRSLAPCIACFFSEGSIELKLKELNVASHQIYIFGLEKLKFISNFSMD